MTKKQFIVGTTGCPGCEEIKSSVKDTDIKYLDVQDSDEALDMITSIGDINAVPTAVEVEDGKVQKCDITMKDNKVVLSCTGEKHELKKLPQ